MVLSKKLPAAKIELGRKFKLSFLVLQKSPFSGSFFVYRGCSVLSFQIQWTPFLCIAELLSKSFFFNGRDHRVCRPRDISIPIELGIKYVRSSLAIHYEYERREGGYQRILKLAWAGLRCSGAAMPASAALASAQSAEWQQCA